MSDPHPYTPRSIGSAVQPYGYPVDDDGEPEFARDVKKSKEAGENGPVRRLSQVAAYIAESQKRSE